MKLFCKNRNHKIYKTIILLYRISSIRRFTVAAFFLFRFVINDISQKKRFWWNLIFHSLKKSFSYKYYTDIVWSQYVWKIVLERNLSCYLIVPVLRLKQYYIWWRSYNVMVLHSGFDYICSVDVFFSGWLTKKIRTIGSNTV